MGVLKCTGYKADCTTRDQIVPANPDIAGIGVIVGFLSTTCLAFLVAFSVLFLNHYEDIVNFYRRCFTKKKEVYIHDVDGPYWRSPTFWARVLSKNLLALADTQLLTGFAIQFTALLQHCRLSIYHFQIVTDLAFLTTITHLLTVVALRNYFVKNRWINLPRIFFMLANLSLLGYTSFVSYSYDLAGLDLSTPLACFYQGRRPDFHSAFGGKWAMLLILAIGGHVAVILAMYVLTDEDIGEGSRWAWVKSAGAIFRTWILAPAYAIYGVFMAGSGLKNTQALGKPTVRIENSESEWGFGQFLPLLLLALPIFAGWESFWEEYDEDRENRFGPSNRASRAGSRSALDVLETQPKSAQLEKRSIGASSEEKRTGSDATNGVNTRQQRSTSRVSIVEPIPMLALPSPHLSIPSPSASPALGVASSQHDRSKSPSRFEEHVT